MIRRAPVLFRTVSLLALATLSLSAQSSPSLGAPPGTSPAALALASARSGNAARFVPNVGQWSSPELFRVQSGGLHYFLERDGWSFWMLEAPEAAAGALRGRRRLADVAPARAVAVRMSFVGHSASVQAQPGSRLDGHMNFLKGDPATHRSRVPSHASVLYSGMYPGIDVRLRDGGGSLQYDLLVAPGADLSQVQIRVAGARALRLEPDGALMLDTDLGCVAQAQPVAWMVAPDGTRRPLSCQFVLRDRESFGFRAPDRDPALPLVVDPPLLYSTYLGGNGNDWPRYVRQDASGRILVCGYTHSTNYPTTPGSHRPSFQGGPTDAFITCIDPTLPPGSQLVFSTYIGGTGDDVVGDIAILPGAVAFTGSSTSDGLATPGVAQATRAGGRDAIVGLLHPSGAPLLALSYHGGAGFDDAYGIAVATNGNLVITGMTRSSDMPTTPNAYRTTLQGASDGFVTEMPATVANRVYSTFVGGTGGDALYWGYVDALGMTLIGESASGDFPTTPGAFDRSFHGGGTLGIDAVLLRWDHWTNPLQPICYSTYIGGRDDEWLFDARPVGNGQIVLSGSTASTDFPTTLGCYSPTYNGGASFNVTGDAIVLRMDPRGQGAQDLVFSTFLGGAAADEGDGCCVDSNGDITIVGWTNTASGLAFPTTPDAMRRTPQSNEGFVARLSADGRQLLYSSYFGAEQSDGAWYAARHADGVVTMVGGTMSLTFPTTPNAEQPTSGGGQDGFVARLSLIPVSTLRYGRPSSGGTRLPTIHALGDAVPGNASFGLACSRAPASTGGVLLISPNAASLPVLGIELLVDLNVSVNVPIASAANGEHRLPIAYPGHQLAPLHAQYLWVDSVSPLLSLSASDALRF